MKFLLPVLCLFIAVVAFSQKPYSLKSHNVTISGTSTLHDWESVATGVEWSGSMTVEGGAVKDIKDAVITIAVEKIKSDKGSTMDEKTWEAFQYDKNPSIIFKLGKLTADGTNRFKGAGTLTMAGATKNIQLNVEAKVNANGTVRFTGSQKINMKDYGMTPPKAVMGTIKVGPAVTVVFEIELAP
jgi:polyisoprenoid-binding protein YceI